MTPIVLDAIRKFEGFSPTAKWDYAQHSNGYGTRARFSGETISRQEAEYRFQNEVSQAANFVEKHASHLDEGTKAALTSLTFNAGTSWANSGLGKAVRHGDLQEVRNIFVQYNKAGGQTLPGLVNRRAIEAAWIGQPLPATSSKQVANIPTGETHPAEARPATSPHTLSHANSAIAPSAPIQLARLHWLMIDMHLHDIRTEKTEQPTNSAAIANTT